VKNNFHSLQIPSVNFNVSSVFGISLPKMKRLQCFHIRKINNEPYLLNQMNFSSEVTFLTNVMLNCHMCRIWSFQNHLVLVEIIHSAPEVNV
jgi:hypothetical protein